MTVFYRNKILIFLIIFSFLSKTIFSYDTQIILAETHLVNGEELANKSLDLDTPPFEPLTNLFGRETIKNGGIIFKDIITTAFKKVSSKAIETERTIKAKIPNILGVKNIASVKESFAGFSHNLYCTVSGWLGGKCGADKKYPIVVNNNITINKRENEDVEVKENNEVVAKKEEDFDEPKIPSVNYKTQYSTVNINGVTSAELEKRLITFKNSLDLNSRQIIYKSSGSSNNLSSSDFVSQDNLVRQTDLLIDASNDSIDDAFSSGTKSFTGTSINLSGSLTSAGATISGPLTSQGATIYDGALTINRENTEGGATIVLNSGLTTSGTSSVMMQDQGVDKWFLGKDESNDFRLYSHGVGDNVIYVSDTTGDIRLSRLTDNGFLKTTGGNGTLVVDTTEFLNTSSASTTYLRLDAANGPLTGALDTDEDITISADNKKLYFGADNDASISYDGTNLIINSAEVGTGGISAGRENTVTGTDAYAFGKGNTASGNYSLVLGYGNTASAYRSASVGYANTVSGTNASAFGYINDARGSNSTSLGYSNESCGCLSSAVGHRNESSGCKSSAFGYLNTSSGTSSSALGYNNIASGYRSSASGYVNTSSDENSVAVGFGNTASATGASVFGSSITNNIACSTMIGPSNTAKMTILSSGNVGIGTTTPSEKLSVIGNGLFSGSLTASSFSGAGTGITGLTTTNFASANISQWTNDSGYLSSVAGDWTGTFDGQEGSYYLDRTNHTGTQLSSTISDFSSTARGLLSSSATGLTYTSGTGDFSLTSGYNIPTTASTTDWTNKVSSQWTTTGSDIYYNGGNVGIGTDSPNAKLHINGVSSGITEGLRLENKQNWAAGRGVKINFYTPYDVGNSREGGSISVVNDSSVSSNYMAFNVLHNSTGNLERMRITRDGNVGIGTTDPQGKLDITTLSNGALTDSLILRNNGTGTGTGTSIKFGLSPSNIRGIISQIYDEGSNAIKIGVGAGYVTPVMTLRESGNVGIGTTTPLYPLHVKSSTGTYALRVQGKQTFLDDRVLVSGANQDPDLYLYESSLASGKVSWNKDNDYLSLSTRSGGTDYTDSLIAKNGNIGIGTASPQKKLHVVDGAGTLPLLGSQIGLFQNNDTSTDNAIFGIIAGEAGTGAQGIAGFQFGDKDAINRGLIYYYNPTDSLYLGTGGSSTSGLTIDGSGNVGIGELSPTYGRFVVMNGGDLNSGIAMARSGGTSTRIWKDMSDNLRFSTGGGANLLTIQQDGKIGIGTTTPQGKLEVSASASGSVPAAGSDGSHLMITAGGLYGTMIGPLGSGTSYIQSQRFDGTAATYPLLLNPNGGNVGIGNSTATYELDIGGFTDTTANALRIVSGTDKKTSIRLMEVSDSYGFSIENDAANNTFNVIRHDADATGTSALSILRSSGNVGIGNTNPVAKLDINIGGSPTGSPVFPIRATQGSGNPGAIFERTDASQFTSLFTGSSGAILGFSAGRLAIGHSAYADRYSTGFPTTEAISILSGGNVGIGATTPSQALDIVGSLELENTTSTSTGVVYKGATPFLHNFQHPTGDTAVPVGRNIFLGEYAGNFTMGSTASQTHHGSYNTGTGFNSLLNNEIGFGNSGFGYFSLRNNTSGYYNTGLGYNTLPVNTTGYYNSALGNDALAKNVSGHYNTALGALTGYSNTTGAYNSSIGARALYGNTTGIYNSAIGYQAGRYIADGTTPNEVSDYSLYLGANTRASADNVQNEIAIGYGTTGGGSNTVTLGNTDIATTILRGNIMLPADNAKLYFGTDNDASISYDGTNLIINSAEVGTGGISAGRGNTVSGVDAYAYGALNTASGDCSTAIGYLNTSSGLYSSSLGFNNTASATSSSAVGRSNIASGSKSVSFGYINTASDESTSAFGVCNTASACWATAVGYINTASGVGASAFGRASNAYGAYSTAMGYNSVACGSRSTSIGYSNVACCTSSTAVGRSNTASGSYSTAIGYLSTASSTNASAIGFNDMATGLKSSAIGYSNTGSGDYSTAMGHSNVACASYSSAIGFINNSCGASSSAIGRSNTSAGACSTAIGFCNTASATGASVFGSNITNATAYSTMIGPSNTAKMTILSSGNVGIGTTTPAQALDLVGNLQLQNTTSTTTGVIYKDNTPFIHNFSHPTGAGVAPDGCNTFVGLNSGNFTMGETTLLSTQEASYNTAIGQNTLSSNTVGYMNSAVGYSALSSNTEGYYNSAVGHNSLANNTTGTSNSAFGLCSMYSNTTGYNNTASGAYSLYLNTEGHSNSAFGNNSLSSNTTGNENSAFGVSSLKSNTTGIYNSALGVASLYNNTIGNDNTALGAFSLYANTSGCFNSAVGDTALFANSTGCFNTASGAYSLSGNSTGSFNTASGAYSLRCNSSGCNNSAVGYQSLFSNTTGQHNAALGAYSLYANVDGNFNTAIGSIALTANTTGFSNTAVGYSSLYANTEGFTNTASGAYSLRSNTTGYANTSSGYMSLFNNTTGDSNTASGYSSLFANTSGYNNSAFGVSSMYCNRTGCDNTASGYKSLRSNNSGCNNLAMGANALYSNVTGHNNTALGYNSGRYIANGVTANASSSESVFLGADSKALVSGGINEIVIGYNAIGAGSNTVTLGNTDIATTTLRGNVRLPADNARLYLGTDDDASIYFDGTDLVIDSPAQYNLTNLGTGDVQSTAGILSVSSDERLKNISGAFTRGISDLEGLDPILYTWKNEKQNVGKDYAGFTAQDVREFIPEAVFENSDGYLSISERPILAASVNAIKELNQRTLGNASSTAVIGVNLAEARATVTSNAFDIKNIKSLIGENGVSTSTKSLLDDLEIRLDELSLITKDQDGLFSTISSSLSDLQKKVESFGAQVINGVVHFVEASFGKIKVGRIVINNEENPEKTGLVIYDRETGEPMCVYFEGGEMKYRDGDCESPDENDYTVNTFRTSSETEEASTAPIPISPSSDSGTAEDTNTTASSTNIIISENPVIEEPLSDTSTTTKPEITTGEENVVSEPEGSTSTEPDLVDESTPEPEPAEVEEVTPAESNPESVEVVPPEPEPVEEVVPEPEPEPEPTPDPALNSTE